MICSAGTNSAGPSDTFFLFDTQNGNSHLSLQNATAVNGIPMRVKLHTPTAGTATLHPTSTQLINGRSSYVLDPEVRWYDMVAYAGEYTIEPSNIKDTDQAKLNDL